MVQQHAAGVGGRHGEGGGREQLGMAAKGGGSTQAACWAVQGQSKGQGGGRCLGVAGRHVCSASSAPALEVRGAAGQLAFGWVREAESRKWEACPVANHAWHAQAAVLTSSRLVSPASSGMYLRMQGWRDAS